MPSTYIFGRGPSPTGGLGLWITKALSIERRIVRVWFNEVPQTRNRNHPNDALNPNNWTILAVPTSDKDIAYFEVVVTEVLEVPDDDYAVDVVVDDDFSFHVNYLVSGQNIASYLYAWIITSDELEFYPFDPPCREKPVPLIYDWFGRAAKRLDSTLDLKRVSYIWQDMMEQIKSLANCLRSTFDILRCPIGYLDARLEYMGKPFADAIYQLTPNQRRLLALHLVRIYKEKGTFRGILEAINLGLGLSAWIWSVKDLQGLSEDLWYLGGGWFDPTKAPDYPTRPITEHPDDQVYAGTFCLGPGNSNLITRFRSFSGPGRWGAGLKEEGAPDNIHYWGLDGRGSIRDNSKIYRFPYIPSGDDENPSPPPQYIDLDRRGIYSFELYLNEETTEVQNTLVRIIANYMKPANTHISRIRLYPETIGADYDPVVLDISLLDVDWILH